LNLITLLPHDPLLLLLLAVIRPIAYDRCGEDADDDDIAKDKPSEFLNEVDDGGEKVLEDGEDGLEGGEDGVED